MNQQPALLLAFALAKQRLQRAPKALIVSGLQLSVLCATWKNVSLPSRAPFATDLCGWTSANSTIWVNPRTKPASLSDSRKRLRGARRHSNLIFLSWFPGSTTNRLSTKAIAGGRPGPPYAYRLVSMPLGGAALEVLCDALPRSQHDHRLEALVCDQGGSSCMLKGSARCLHRNNKQARKGRARLRADMPKHSFLEKLCQTRHINHS